MTKPIEDSTNAAAIRAALDVPTTAALTAVDAAAQAASSAAAGKYTKPADGIPAADLTAATQALLAKADAALPGNADALADLLEAAPTADPASLARIQSSVSEAGAINAALTVNTSRNIFDFRKATDGYYLDSAGNLAVTPLNGFSALIPVTVGQQYVGSHGGVSGNHIRMHCFYAANGVTVVPGGSSSAVSTFTAPAGAVFVRVTYNITSQLNKQQFQLEAGSVATNLTTPDNGLTGSVVVPDESVPAISRSRNLFDPGAAVDGVYIDQNNNVVASAALGVSGYIPVEPGAIYRASDWVGVGNGAVSDNSVLRFTTF